MADYTHVFEDQETTNWFKALIALNITKEGLTGFVDTEIQKVHQAVGMSCGQCSIENILKCPTKGICRNARNCNFHNTPAKLPRPCPANVCEKVQDNIVVRHRYQGPSWRNTHAESWATNHWEIAKCFMPRDGYTGVSSIHETDFNGVINVMMNCVHFDTCLSFTIATQPATFECLLTKARKIGRAVRHTSDCKVTDADLQDYFLTLTALLSDQQCLAQDPAAKAACMKLQAFQKHRLSITQEELGTLLKDAQQTLVNVTKSGERLSQEVESVLNDINMQLNNCLQILDERANEDIERVSQQSVLARNEITIYTRSCLQNIEKSAENVTEKGREIDKKARTIDEKVKEIETTAHNIEEHAQKIENDARKIDARVQVIENMEAKRINLDTDQTSYERDVEEFRRRVILHYNSTLNHVPLSPLNPGNDMYTLQEIYAAPAMYRLKQNDSKLRQDTTSTSNLENDQINRSKKISICNYNDLFGSCAKLNQRIFLQGDAGTGKSTFVAKLVLDWCKGFQSSSKHADESSFKDVGTLQKFKFVFLVTLRDSISEREVAKIIKEQLIGIVYSGVDRKKAYRLLQRILEKEICLVIQDGLDEWIDVKGKLAQPLMVSSHSQCTVLTTSRPWKLTDERIRCSEIDSLLFLDGLSDPREFSKIVLRCIVRENLNDRFNEFQNYVKLNKLDDLLSKPMLLISVVCSFVDGIRMKGSSCEIYSILLDSLLKKVSDKMGYFQQPPVQCFENTRYVQPNIEKLDAISTLAFRMLFSFEKEMSLAFDDRHLFKYVSEEQKSFALRSGILSERKCSSILHRSSTCSFIHKSVQEFLAAYYVASNEHVIDEVISKYVAHISEDVLDMSQIFIFLCGLNIQAANELSNLLDKHSNRVDKTEFQDMIISGYRAAKANGIDDDLIHLKLSYFSFRVRYGTIFKVSLTAKCSRYAQYCHFLNCILQSNRSNVRSLLCDNCKYDTANSRLCLPVHDLQGIIASSADCLECLEVHFAKHWWKVHQVVVGDQTFSSGLDVRKVCLYAFIPKPDVMMELKGLKTIELSGYNELFPGHCDINMLFPTSNSCVSSFEEILIPSNLEHITLDCVAVSSTWLRQLLIKLSTLDHHVKCTIAHCNITPSEKFNSMPSDPKKHIYSDSANATIGSCAKNVSLEVRNDCFGLYEALLGLHIHNLRMYRFNYDNLLAELIPNLTKLDRLRIDALIYFEIELPRSVSFVHFNYRILKPSELRNMLHTFSTMDHNLECRLLFGYKGVNVVEYKPIKQELEGMKYAGVLLKSFKLYDAIKPINTGHEDTSPFHYILDKNIPRSIRIELVINR